MRRYAEVEEFRPAVVSWPAGGVEVLPGDRAATDHPDPDRPAHISPRSMTVWTVGCARTSRLWPGVQTKIRPLPQRRVQMAGEVISRCHSSHGRTFWVVVAMTSR